MQLEKKIKVCMAARFYFYDDFRSGLQTYVQTLSEGLAKKGAEVHVVCFTKDEKNKDKIISYTPNLYIHPVFYDNDLLRYSVGWLELRSKIKEIEEKYDFDILHLHTSHCSPFMYICDKSREEEPLIITHHESGTMADKQGDVFGLISKLFCNGIFKRSTRTAVSEAAGEVYGKESFLNIGSFVDYDFYNPALFDKSKLKKEILKGKYNLDGSFVAIYPAWIGPEKNQLDAIKAVEEVAKNLDPDQTIKLLIMGSYAENRDYKKLLDEYIIKHDLDDIVLILSGQSREDLRKFYAASDVLISTTKYSEGWPLCFMEGIAMRLPIITYDSGGAREAVQNWKTGFLVKKGDYRKMAQLINLLIERPDFKERLSNYGKKSERNFFSKEKFVNRVMNL